jgi:hypothetical protein
MKRNDGESGQSNENSNPNVHFNQVNNYCENKCAMNV